MDFILIGIAILLYMVPVFLALVVTLSIKANLNKAAMKEPDRKQLLIYTFIGAFSSVVIINLFSIEEWSAILVAIIVGTIVGIVFPDRE